MSTVNLGPLAVPVGPLVLLAATFIATMVARRADRAAAAVVETRLWLALGAGLLAARLAFVALHFRQYRGAPAAIPDIRDGGFVTLAGLLVAAAVVAWFGWHKPEGRKALLRAAVAGVSVWMLGMAASLLLRGAPGQLPELQLTTLDGRPVSLHSLAGKPMVVNMWATWCPPCRREMPVLAAAQAQHKDIVFVFVNQGQSAEAVQAYLAQQGLTLDNVLLDPAMALGQAVGSQALPTTVFADAAGRLVERRIGGLSAATLEQKIASLPRAH